MDGGLEVEVRGVHEGLPPARRSDQLRLTAPDVLPQIVVLAPQGFEPALLSTPDESNALQVRLAVHRLADKRPDLA